MEDTVAKVRKCSGTAKISSRYTLHTFFSSSREARFATACAAWLLLLPGAGTAAEGWHIDPHVAVSETYTDNVNLSASGQEKSDFITTLTPGISINGEHGRSRLRFDYNPQILYYIHDTDLNRVNHQLSTDARAELARNVFFVDASASVSRETVSLLGPISVSNNTVGTQNETTLRTYRVSPYFTDRLGSAANYEIRYQRDGVSAGDDLLSNSEANKYVFNMVSGPTFNRYTWGVGLSQENVDYKNATDQESKDAHVDFNYFLTPRFALTAEEGYEKYNYLTSGEKPQGNYWSAGIFWQPSSLTSLKLSTGQHYYGHSNGLEFLHRSRAFLWRASYSQSVNSTRSNFINNQKLLTTLGAITTNPDEQKEILKQNFPNLTAGEINALVVSGIANKAGVVVATPINFLTNEIFLEKRSDASVTWYSGKTTIVFSAFRDIRNALTDGTFASILGSGELASSKNVEQTGANLLFDWSVAPRTSASVNIGYNDLEFRDTDTSQKLKYIRAGLRRSLTPKATGAIDVRHEQSDANGTTSSYRENAISASINLRF